MRHIWTVFCRNILEDKNTNNVSLIEVIERIAFKAEDPGTRPIPLPLPTPFVLVSNWWREDGEDPVKRQARMRFLSPTGEELLNFVHEVDLENSEKMRVNGELGSLPYTINGTYEFEISYEKDGEWTTVASIPLEIIREDPAESDSETSS